MNHRPARFIALLLVAASMACQYDPFAHDFTSVRPTDEDLIGQYELDDNSIEMLRQQHSLPRPSSRFVLQRDGTFAITDVPTCWRDAVECSSDLESANGTWRVVKENEWWVVRLHLARIQGKTTDYGMDANVRGERSPRLIHFTVGDPDAGRALAFRKLSVPDDPLQVECPQGWRVREAASSRRCEQPVANIVPNTQPAHLH